MPPNDHLLWTEVKDFRPGLWTLEPLKAPASAASQMDDCLPGERGGLYPFFKSGAGPTALAAGETPRGAGTTHVETSSATSEVFLMSGNELYRASGGNFALVETAGPGSGGSGQVQFVQRLQGDGTVGRVFFGSSSGVAYRPLNLFAGASTLMSAGARAPLTTHQSRVVCIDTASRNRILFTDPGGLTLPAGNTITPDPGTGEPHIIGLAAFSPSDLVVLYASGMTVMVQGDLSDPTIRVLGRGPRFGSDHRSIERLSDGSLVCFAEDRGLYQFTGEAWVPFHPQINPGAVGPASSTTWGSTNSAGAPTFLRRGTYLFTQLGFIYDETTQSWFRSSGLTNAWTYFDHSLLAGSDSVIGMPITAVAAAGPQVSLSDRNTDGVYLGAPGAFGTNRVRNYTWQSVPLRHPEGQLSSVREVEVFIENQNSYSAALPAVQLLAPGFVVTNTVTVTVNGIVRSAVVPNTKQFDLLRFQFPRGVDQYSTVTVNVATTDNALTSGAGSANNEISSPPIESVRFGFSPGRQPR